VFLRVRNIWVVGALRPLKALEEIDYQSNGQRHHRGSAEKAQMDQANQARRIPLDISPIPITCHSTSLIFGSAGSGEVDELRVSGFGTDGES
jgi:hypothetical protein